MQNFFRLGQSFSVYINLWIKQFFAAGYCRMLRNFSGLYPLGITSIPTPSWDSQTNCQVSLGKQICSG